MTATPVIDSGNMSGWGKILERQNFTECGQTVCSLNGARTSGMMSDQIVALYGGRGSVMLG